MRDDAAAGLPGSSLEETRSPTPEPLIRLTAQEPAQTDGWVLLQIPRSLVVLTRREFIQGLRRGKGWKRRHALAMRISGGEHHG